MPWKFNPFIGLVYYVPSNKVKSIIKDVWNNDVSLGDGGAIAEVEFDQHIFKFGPGIVQGLKARIKVPHDYSSAQLNAFITCYSESVANNFLLKTVATLIRINDPANAVTNQRTSTNLQVPIVAPAYKKQIIICDLTDATGKINGVAVSADDIIDIYLYRDTATSDEPSDIRVIPFVDVIKS